MTAKRTPFTAELAAELFEITERIAKDTKRANEIKTLAKSGKKLGEFPFGDYVVKRWNQTGGLVDDFAEAFPAETFPDLYRDEIDPAKAAVLLPPADYPHIYSNVPDVESIKRNVPEEAQKKIFKAVPYVKVVKA